MWQLIMLCSLLFVPTVHNWFYPFSSPADGKGREIFRLLDDIHKYQDLKPRFNQLKKSNEIKADSDSIIVEPDFPVFRLKTDDDGDDSSSVLESTKIDNAMAHAFGLNLNRNHPSGSPVSSSNESLFTNKSSEPETVYPQILVFMDFSLFQKLNKNVDNAVLYSVIFVNAVNKRLRTLTDPKFKLSFAGLLIGTDRHTTLNVYNVEKLHKNDDVDNEILSIEDAFRGFSRYLREKNLLGSLTFDVAIALTAYELRNVTFDNVDATEHLGATGGSLIGSVCQNQRANIAAFWSTAIVRDRGVYDGVEAAVHELGHVFGAHHSDDCSSVRNVMSQGILFEPNWFDWAECSRRQISNFIRHGPVQVTCINNKPANDDRIKVPDPGQMLSLDKQCHYRGYFANCDIDNACSSLSCLTAEKECKSMQSAAAVGSFCGSNNEICLDGRCVQV